MDGFRLDQLMELLTGTELLVGCLWAGLVALTITLLVLMRTRWGQSHPLRKCLILSFLAHALLAGYATTIQIVASSSPVPEEPAIRVAIAENEEPGEVAQFSRDPATLKPWESFVHEATVKPEPEQLARAETGVRPEVERRTAANPSALPGAAPLDYLAMADAAAPEPESLPAGALGSKRLARSSAEPIDAPAAQRREAVRRDMPQEPSPKRRETDGSSASPARTSRPGVAAALLERPLPVPRLTDVSKSAKPEAPRAWQRDDPSILSRGHPAETVNGPSPQTDSEEPAAGEPGAGPSDTSAGTLRPPSIAGNSAAGPRGQADTGPGDTGLRLLPGPRRNRIQDNLPSLYQLRVAPDRSRQAERRGATAKSEEAVKAALKWLADNQSTSGAWIARQYGAGREMQVAGRDRLNAGIRADTGMTGLALLAMVAAGNTHRQGLYQENVLRGLGYLIESQSGNGNLAGQATDFAAMYCHGMAAFALSEAYGMTGDVQLRDPVRRAVAYSAATQNPTTGGWRYQQGDDGDTSQLGWQLMALKSAELAGIPVAERTWQGAARFLNRVSSGSYQGLAAYRPNERISRPMTAEALVCRQFLGLSPESAAAKEAGDYLLGELPGEAGVANLYYWYYGTLGMYQLQGAHWQRWNDALQQTLVGMQRKEGALSGSWDPDTLWGGYGGRVYSTALAVLCLEVYYRYLPLYLQSAEESLSK